MKNTEQLQDYSSTGSTFTTTTSSNQSLASILENRACQQHLEKHLGKVSVLENRVYLQQLVESHQEKDISNVYEEDSVTVHTSEKKQVSHIDYNISSSRKGVFYSANEKGKRQFNTDRVVVDFDHYSKLRQHAATLWKENVMTDITVYIGTKAYPAHKVVLTSYSPFFRGHIMAKGLEKINKIQIIGIKPASFEVLLRFMYTGEFKPGIHLIGDIYRASLKLKIWEVSRKCAKLLKGEEGGPSSILYVYATSKMLGLTQAAAHAYQTILKEFEDIIVTPEFLDLEASQLCEILSADAIGTRSEIVIYLAALKWLDHDFLKREEYMPEVMKCIRFSTMTLEEVLACYHPPILPGITQYPVVRDLLLKATCYLAAKSTKQNKNFEEYSSKPRLFLAKTKHRLGWYGFDWDILRVHNDAAIRIQSSYRGYTVRKEFLRRKKAAITIQAQVRGYHARTSYNLIKSKPQLSYNIKGGTICLDDPCLQTLIHCSDCTHISRQLDVRLALLPKCEDSVQETNTPVLLVLGGINPNSLSRTSTGDSMLRYLPTEDKWEHCGYLPEPRHHHMAVFLNRCVYVIGGYDPRITKNGKLVASKSCFRYNLESQKWQKISDMKYARVYHGAAALAGFIYVVGGKDEKGRLISSVELFNPGLNAWEELDVCLCCPRMAMGIAVHKDQLWISGGIIQPFGGRYIFAVSNVDRFVPKLNNWSSDVAYLPSPRSFTSMLESKGRLHVVGGGIQHSQDIGNLYLCSTVDVLMYVDEADQWFSCVPLPSPRHGVGASSIGGVIFVCGGLTTNGIGGLSEVLVKGVNMDKWNVCKELPFPVSGHAVVTIPKLSRNLSVCD